MADENGNSMIMKYGKMKTMGTNMDSDAFLIINQVINKMKQPSNGEQFNHTTHTHSG